ncbi:MAG: hypothetical protein GY754_06460 [bacterium]|nr:hypothetical protein [bacterium]
MNKRWSVSIFMLFFMFFAYGISGPIMVYGQAGGGENKAPRSREEMEKDIDELHKRLDELNEKVDDISALKISGFFDVSLSNYKNKPNIFSLGDFELDIQHSYKENFEVAAALVFHEGAELKVGFIDYHIFGGSISPRDKLFVEKGLHIQIGKFDVPVGNDWQHITAISRVTVTAPLTTEKIMGGGYNDTGLRIMANFVAFNATFYLLHGLEEKYSYGGNSLGGRIGFTPFSNPYMLRARESSIFEVGASYIYDIDREGNHAESVLAFDAESKLGPLNLRGEYYKRDRTLGVYYTGFQVTGTVDFGNIGPVGLLLFTRYGYFNMDVKEIATDRESLMRITGGFNLNIVNILHFKLEYQQHFNGTAKSVAHQYYSERLGYIQLVIKF